VVTDPQANRPTHKQTGSITIHCTAKLSVQCNDRVLVYWWWCSDWSFAHLRDLVDRLQEVYLLLPVPALDKHLKCQNTEGKFI